MSSPLRIYQILHPAPEERLQTVAEIKKSRLFDGVYVTVDNYPLLLLIFFKEIGRRWHAERFIHRSYPNLCGKAKWSLDQAGIEGCCCFGFSATLRLVQVHCLVLGGLSLQPLDCRHLSLTWTQMSLRYLSGLPGRNGVDLGLKLQGLCTIDEGSSTF